MAAPQQGSPVIAGGMSVALATSRTYRAGRRNGGNDPGRGSDGEDDRAASAAGYRLRRRSRKSASLTQALAGRRPYPVARIREASSMATLT